VVKRGIFRSIFDWVLPRECAACRTGYEESTAFCGDCEAELEKLESAARCLLCAMPVTLPGAPCAQCVGSGLTPFDQIVCFGVMKEPLKQLIHHAKYHGRWPLAELLADRLARRVDVREMLEHADVVVPVPLHRTKQIERGYNQAEVIARRICWRFNASRGSEKKLRYAESLFDGQFDAQRSGWGYRRLFGSGLRVVPAARRIRPTETQTQMPSRAKRVENLRDAFALIDPATIEDKQVVLVDDVMTTGATLVSLARTLKKANPRNISAIVLAVADPKGRAFEVI
jgi:predicted amidophosphoribosyltransferase